MVLIRFHHPDDDPCRPSRISMFNDFDESEIDGKGTFCFVYGAEFQFLNKDGNVKGYADFDLEELKLLASVGSRQVMTIFESDDDRIEDIVIGHGYYNCNNDHVVVVEEAYVHFA